MPRFFFDTSDGIRFVRDPDGLDLCGPADARAEAIAVLPELARSVVRGSNRRDVFCDVRDECGRLVLTASLTMLARWVD